MTLRQGTQHARRNYLGVFKESHVVIEERRSVRESRSLTIRTGVAIVSLSTAAIFDGDGRTNDDKPELGSHAGFELIIVIIINEDKRFNQTTVYTVSLYNNAVIMFSRVCLKGKELVPAVIAYIVVYFVESVASIWSAVICCKTSCCGQRSVGASNHVRKNYL